jgi:Flp pilus assembly protein TadD
MEDVRRRMKAVGSGSTGLLFVLTALMLLGLITVLAAGCSDDGSDVGTTTTAAGSMESTPTVQGAETTGPDTSTPGEADTTPGTSTQTYTVGGKTPEEYQAEIPNLQAQLEQTPDDLVTLQQLALAQYQTADYVGALDTYEKMLAIKDDPMTRNNYANVMRDAGMTEDAMSEYRQAIDDDPTLVVAYINLASVLLRDDKVDDAMAVLDEGIAATTGEDQQRLQEIKDTLLAQQTPTTAAP